MCRNDRPRLHKILHRVTHFSFECFVITMTHVLPPLPYAIDALGPHVSKEGIGKANDEYFVRLHLSVSVRSSFAYYSMVTCVCW
jgi:hypothetical protein